MNSRRRCVGKSVGLTFSFAIWGWTVGAQTSIPVHIAVGYGVDTASTPNHEIFALWSRYLAGSPSCGRPTPDWSAAERARWPDVDLLCGYVYQGNRLFTVVDLEPAAGMDSTYLIRTLVGNVGDSGVAYYPLALYRTYAVREGSRWVLANALLRETREWHHERVGRVTFVFPATHTFVRGKAEGAARFVDSLAAAWSLTPGGTIRSAGTSVAPLWIHGKSDSNMVARRSKTSTK